MRTAARLVALVLMIGALVFWGSAGANRGWTKTSVPVRAMDEITGIEAITYEKRFVPGVDFLGAAGLGAVGLTAVSFLFRKRIKT
jgi:hypothetical protein